MAKYCVVCRSRLIQPLETIEDKIYWKCNNCLAKFLDKAYQLDPDNEKSRYLQHNNDINDHSYRAFLSKLSEPLKAKLLPGDFGLDFGCGPGPALANMLQLEGYSMEIYDPFFFPDTSILTKEYSFITCTETAEHFFNPYQEFKNLDKILIKGGWLALMTCFMTKDELFKDWYYRRDPTHVSFYSEETFSVIASQRNWTVEIPSKDIVLFNKK
jgi:2-polyprenyl-3-methyl-5-hydroxy-6-metoxy-1,4-benzoquinol methylase|tara:strand:- start:118 stop:756 length:639 start_codon:yes stop_codon:yes gene_type:complete